MSARVGVEGSRSRALRDSAAGGEKGARGRNQQKRISPSLLGFGFGAARTTLARLALSIHTNRPFVIARTVIVATATPSTGSSELVAVHLARTSRRVSARLSIRFLAAAD